MIPSCHTDAKLEEKEAKKIHTTDRFVRKNTKLAKG